MVIKRPEMLIGVSGSWKTMPAAEIVTTSLKIPQIDNVTTEVRCSRANSEEVIRNARQPGNRSRPAPLTAPSFSTSFWMPAPKSAKPSTGMAIMAKARNITGARKKIPLNGFDVAGLRSKRIWVRDQRKPEKKAEEMTSIKPRAENSVSPATIMMTPRVMVAMMSISLTDGVSKRKRKAKMRTKARAEDLHMASREDGWRQ